MMDQRKSRADWKGWKQRGDNMKYVIYLRKKRQNNKMINTQGREVPQPEGISRATFEEKPGVKDKKRTISPPQPGSVPVQNTPISCYSFSHLSKKMQCNVLR